MQSEAAPASTRWDAWVFSSAIPAWVAISLCLAAGLSFGEPPPVPVLLLAGAGTLAIYNIDRLRDLSRDRATSPARSAFVTRRRGTLVVVAALAAVFATALGLSMPRSVWFLCASVALAGLLHRRLKSIPGFKTVYVTLSWVAVCVGLPALVATPLPSATLLVGVGVVFGAAIAPNVMLSNLRDRENLAGRAGSRIVLRAAGGFCIAGVGVALLSPWAPTPLAAVPLAEGIALVGFRPSERYGLAAIDGALGIGATLAVALSLFGAA